MNHDEDIRLLFIKLEGQPSRSHQAIYLNSFQSTKTLAECLLIGSVKQPVKVKPRAQMEESTAMQKIQVTRDQKLHLLKLTRQVKDAFVRREMEARVNGGGWYPDAMREWLSCILLGHLPHHQQEGIRPLFEELDRLLEMDRAGTLEVPIAKL